MPNDRKLESTPKVYISKMSSGGWGIWGSKWKQVGRYVFWRKGSVLRKVPLWHLARCERRVALLSRHDDETKTLITRYLTWMSVPAGYCMPTCTLNVLNSGNLTYRTAYLPTLECMFPLYTLSSEKGGRRQYGDNFLRLLRRRNSDCPFHISGTR